MHDAVLAIRLPFPVFHRHPPAGLGSLSDEALMGRYRDGDSQAFEELYRRHRDRLHRFVVRMVPTEADEVFQEVWLAIVKARDRYTAEARFVTYLFTIAHHRAVARLRSAGRGAVMTCEDAGENVPDEQPNPLEAASNAELGQALQIAIAGLPPLQREAFLMQAEGELSLAEIAEATGTSRETVKSRLRYASRRLRAALEDWK